MYQADLQNMAGSLIDQITANIERRQEHSPFLLNGPISLERRSQSSRGPRRVIPPFINGGVSMTRGRTFVVGEIPEQFRPQTAASRGPIPQQNHESIGPSRRAVSFRQSIQGNNSVRPNPPPPEMLGSMGRSQTIYMNYRAGNNVTNQSSPMQPPPEMLGAMGRSKSMYMNYKKESETQPPTPAPVLLGPNGRSGSFYSNNERDSESRVRPTPPEMLASNGRSNSMYLSFKRENSLINDESDVTTTPRSPRYTYRKPNKSNAMPPEPEFLGAMGRSKTLYMEFREKEEEKTKTALGFRSDDEDFERPRSNTKLRHPDQNLNAIDYEVLSPRSSNESRSETRPRVKSRKSKVKEKEAAVIAKSSVLLDVKPWDDETDMKAMEDAVRTIEMDGLVWGASKLVPVGYGIKKLTIMCVVEDEKVSIDELSDLICEFEDFVQSVDIAAFNKI